MDELAALKKAVDVAGGQSRLAEKIGVRQQHVWNWLNKMHRVPAKFALKVEAVTGVSRHDLRPDYYPREHRA